MEECPFLSTYEKDEECFRGCALYNYKDTGGICPFKKASEHSVSLLKNRNDLIDFYEKDYPFLRNSFLEERNQYL